MSCTLNQRAVAVINLMGILGLQAANHPWLDHKWSILAEINDTINGVQIRNAWIQIPDELADWWCKYESLITPPYAPGSGFNSDLEVLLSAITANVPESPPNDIDISNGLREFLRQ
jgi:hypothetical protein